MSVTASSFLVASAAPILYGSRGSIVSFGNVSKTTACCSVTSAAKNNIVSSSISGTRRSADYMPSVWDYNVLRSLTPLSTAMVEKYAEEHLEMIAEVKPMINEVTWADPVMKLEFIDNIQRLGLQRHFEKEINDAMDGVYKDGIINRPWPTEELHACALCFRLLRQHGYHVSEGVFAQFKNDQSDHFNKELIKDVKGLLSLYEASFLGWEGDHIVNEANAFATKHLREEVKNKYNHETRNSSPSWIIEKVEHALEMPLHWRVPKFEARWFIDMYGQQGDREVNYTLLRLAKLDYNLGQAAYREEVRKLASWWIGLDVGMEKVPYARDRLLEHYLWVLGMVQETEFNYFREMGTKIISLISTLDDTYDVYGTVEELTVLTNLFDRWDLNGIDQLPQYIKLCLLAIYNTTNEVGFWTLKEKSFNIIPYLSKEWRTLSNKYLEEAKWYHAGKDPTLEEYVENGWVSIAGPLMLFVCYFLTAEDISKECLDFIAMYPDIMRHSSIIFRLTNDLGTSSDELTRGDNKKSIQLYMNHMGVSEEEARRHVNGMIFQTWKKLNKDYYLTKYPYGICDPFLTANLNLVRASHSFYQYDRDGHGKPNRETKDHIRRLIVDPIPL